MLLEPNLSGESLLTKLVHFIETSGDDVLAGRKKLKLSPRALEYVTGRLSSLEELHGLKAAAPVEFLRGCVSNLDDYKRLERLTFLRSLEHLTVAPLRGRLRDPTPLQLSQFGSLTSLELRDCDLASCMPAGLDFLRACLVRLRVVNSLEALSHLLQLQSPQPSSAAPPVWSRLQHLSCPRNAVSSMDPSLKLLPALCTLDLSRNQVTSISNLEACTRLTSLNLGCNNIVDCLPLATCPSLQHVSLPWNAIASLEGLDALPQLRHLDIRGNRVRQLGELTLLATLPDLRELLLERNPIACVSGWRISVLACFLETFSLLSLDGEEPSPQEHRRAGALMQRRAARKGFTTCHPQQFPRAHGKQPAPPPGPAPPLRGPLPPPESSAASSSSFHPRLEAATNTALGNASTRPPVVPDEYALGALRQQRTRARVVDFDFEPLPKSGGLTISSGSSRCLNAPLSSGPGHSYPSPSRAPPSHGSMANSSLKSVYWDAMQAFVDGQATGSIPLEDELPAAAHSPLLWPPAHASVGTPQGGMGTGGPSTAARKQRPSRLSTPPRFEQAMMERVRVSSSMGHSTGSPPSAGQHSGTSDSSCSLDASDDSGEDDH